MKSSSIALALLPLVGSVIAAPTLVAEPLATPQVTPAPQIEDLEKRQLNLLSGLGGVASSALGGVVSALSQAQGTGNVLSSLALVTPTATPTNEAQAISSLSSILQVAKPTNILEYDALLVLNGLTTQSVSEGLADVLGEFGPMDSSSNSNTDPPTSVYPKKNSCDAPYSISESKLRSAIYIPDSFTYGAKPPVVLFPGTGATGYITFDGNFIPLLQNVDYADPVWVNVPGFLLDDAQHNAEYAAYALNYISSLTKTNVSVIGWSQGNIDIQWAFKYWPSTRQVTNDHIAISPDYKGTTIASFADISGLTNDPSVLQQEYFSNFITTLRANGGDSAYVPTTTVYSGFFDEIVEPQQGTGASAFLNDARNVGVSNTEVQNACPGLPAGSFYTHEGVLYNPIAYGLAMDALKNPGPGQLSRVDTATLCGMYAAPGLTLEDILVTENSILVAGITLLTYLPKMVQEPVISAYATASSTCALSTTKSATTLSTTTKKATTTTAKASSSTSTTKAKASSSTTSTTTKASSSSSATKTSSSTSTTKASSTTSTTKASSPTSTITCPSANGSTFLASNGATFLIECGVDHAGGDLGAGVSVPDFNTCINKCATTSGCVDVSLSGVACYLKSSLGAAQNNGNVWGAKLITPAP